MLHAYAVSGQLALDLPGIDMTAPVAVGHLREDLPPGADPTQDVLVAEVAVLRGLDADRDVVVINEYSEPSVCWQFDSPRATFGSH